MTLFIFKIYASALKCVYKDPDIVAVTLVDSNFVKWITVAVSYTLCSQS